MSTSSEAISTFLSKNSDMFEEDDMWLNTDTFTTTKEGTSIQFEVDVDFTEEFPAGFLTKSNDGYFVTFQPMKWAREPVQAHTWLQALEEIFKDMEKKRETIMNELADSQEDQMDYTDDADVSDDTESDYDMATPVEGNDDWTNVMETKDVYSMKKASEKDYNILDREQFMKKQKNDVEKIMETLFMTNSQARIVLRSYEWNVEKILNKFFDHGKEKVLKDVGLSEKQIDFKDPMHDAEGLFECPLCYDEYPYSETSVMPACGHRFCNGCWSDYITVMINDGQSKKIKCPYHGCEWVVDDNLVNKFVNDEKTQKKYDEKMVESIVDDNPHLTWCPSIPPCGNAVETKLNPNVPLEVHCNCGHQFCFKCGDEPHLPSSCQMLNFWKVKCKDDSETVNWIKSNCRSCPRCHVSVNKNGGCHHITCSNCNAHFCWKCLKLFDAQTVYSHQCGGYKEEESVSDAKNTLRRYLHYYERFQLHNDSKKFEKDARKKLKAKIKEMFKLKPNSFWVEVQWLKIAFEVLVSTRRALAYSYVFAFYLYDESGQRKKIEGLVTMKDKNMAKNNQLLFEDTQSQLENTTEQLAHLLEFPIKQICEDTKIKNQIIGAALANEKRMFALFDIIRKNCVDQNKYHLPDPARHITTDSSL